MSTTNQQQQYNSNYLIDKSGRKLSIINNLGEQLQWLNDNLQQNYTNPYFGITVYKPSCSTTNDPYENLDRRNNNSNSNYTQQRQQQQQQQQYNVNNNASSYASSNSANYATSGDGNTYNQQQSIHPTTQQPTYPTVIDHPVLPIQQEHTATTQQQYEDGYEQEYQGQIDQPQSQQHTYDEQYTNTDNNNDVQESDILSNQQQHRRLRKVGDIQSIATNQQQQSPANTSRSKLKNTASSTKSSSVKSKPLEPLRPSRSVLAAKGLYNDIVNATASKKSHKKKQDIDVIDDMNNQHEYQAEQQSTPTSVAPYPPTDTSITASSVDPWSASKHYDAINVTPMQDEQTRQWSGSDFQWSNHIVDIMRNVFGVHKFRPLQEEVINATLSGADTILLMPTGSGKSLCFQVPALVQEGVTIVFSPLLSLMEDQVGELQKCDIYATSVTSNTSRAQVDGIIEDLLHNRVKFLYITPEKFANSSEMGNLLQRLYRNNMIQRFVVDEVHCVSTWGHDFRKDYLQLCNVRTQFPNVPIMALTATATIQVIDNVKSILNIPNAYLFRASLNRINLKYIVKKKVIAQKVDQRELHSDDDIVRLIQERYTNLCGIIYTATINNSNDLADYLQQNGISAESYNAAMSAKAREQTQRRWMHGNINVVVATIAFGMGFGQVV